ncbi:MAG: tripartite tricarboxylate transporter TctB family protein [Tabrizicola sp.]|nr:tripartite tricarboxylate transporter TctB family protein [Tabrizicola sp.]
MTGDRVFGLFMIVLALGYFLSATTIQSSFMADPVGPRVFPYMIAGVTVICALSMILRPDPDASWPGLALLGKLGLSLLVLIAYALTIRPLGFILPTALAAAFLSYQMNPRPVPAIASGIGLGLGLFVLFKFVLGLGLHAWPRDLFG